MILTQSLTKHDEQIWHSLVPQYRRIEQPELQMKINGDLIPWVGGEFDAASLHLRQQIFHYEQYFANGNGQILEFLSIGLRWSWLLSTYQILDSQWTFEWTVH